MSPEQLKKGSELNTEINILKRVKEQLDAVSNMSGAGLNFTLSTDRIAYNDPGAEVFVPKYKSNTRKAISDGFVAALQIDLAQHIADLEKQLADL